MSSPDLLDKSEFLSSAGNNLPRMMSSGKIKISFVMKSLRIFYIFISEYNKCGQLKLKSGKEDYSGVINVFIC